MAKVQIIVGTVTGTAQGVAEYCQKKLAEQHQIHLNPAATGADLTRDPDELLIFCTSNTGSGDLPPAMASVYQCLTTEYPNIAYRKYGVINLGDSSYPTFGEAGRLLDAALQDIGAQPLQEMLTIDACENRYPQNDALAYAESLLEAFQQTR